MNNSILIAVTGIDGSGKSTLLSNLEAALSSEGLRTARFINHVPFSSYWNSYKKMVRAIESVGGAPPYDFDRLMHSMELVEKCDNELPQLLAENDIVLSDRYMLDKIIYGRLRGVAPLAEQALTAIERMPDLTLFVDVSASTATQRISRDNGPVDWKERPEMLVVAREAYHSALARNAFPEHNIVRINGERDVSDVTAEAFEYIIGLVPQ